MPTHNRSIEINKEIIPYKLRYSKKARYLRIQINSSNELEVILPRGCKISDAEKFIVQKSKWVRNHLKEKKIEEEKFLFLGKEIIVRQEFDLFLTAHKISFRKAIDPGKNEVLSIVSPPENNVKLNSIYDFWLRKQAELYIIKRTGELAESLNFSINRVSIKGQKTRWGSCSNKKNLSFNFKLMKFRKEIIDYVIIHELCHLKEMNHSKKFWNLVEKYCPHYKALRKELNHGKSI